MNKNKVLKGANEYKYLQKGANEYKYLQKGAMILY